MVPKTNSLTTSKQSSLSIQVRLDGLSFFSQNLETKEIGSYDTIPFDTNANPANLSKFIKKIFSEHAVLSQDYERVTVIYENDLYTVVPEVLFESKHASDYLKFNTKILSTDFISHDTLEDIKKVVVYIPYTNVNNYFFDRYGSFNYFHSTTLLLEHITTKTPPNAPARVYAHIKENSFDLIVIEKGKLLLTNTYAMTTIEDFLYYLLFTFEQLGLAPEEVPLALLGNVKQDSPVFEAAYKYVRHTTILTPVSSIFKEKDAILATLL